MPTTGGNLCNNHVSHRLNTDVRYFKCPTINAHIFYVRPQQRNKQTRIHLRLHANENHQENGKRLTPLTRCNGIGVLQRPGCKKRDGTLLMTANQFVAYSFNIHQSYRQFKAGSTLLYLIEGEIQLLPQGRHNSRDLRT